MLKFGSESIRDELCEKAEKVKGEILVTEWTGCFVDRMRYKWYYIV
jgi:hypothetical protein